MTERLRCVPKNYESELAAQESPVVRRLRRDEFQTIRSSKEMSQQQSERVAVILVLPPINNRFARLKEEQPERSVPRANPGASAPRWPLLEMVNGVSENHGHSSAASGEHVPLYNCVSMFTEREQREQLHRALLGLLGSERKRLWRSQGPEKGKGIILLFRISMYHF